MKSRFSSSFEGPATYYFTIYPVMRSSHAIPNDKVNNRGLIRVETLARCWPLSCVQWLPVRSQKVWTPVNSPPRSGRVSVQYVDNVVSSATKCIVLLPFTVVFAQVRHWRTKKHCDHILSVYRNVFPFAGARIKAHLGKNTSSFEQLLTFYFTPFCCFSILVSQPISIVHECFTCCH